MTDPEDNLFDEDEPTANARNPFSPDSLEDHVNQMPNHLAALGQGMPTMSGNGLLQPNALMRQISAIEAATQANRERLERLRRSYGTEREHEERTNVIFGNREDRERLGSDYVSPITGLFTEQQGRTSQDAEPTGRVATPYQDALWNQVPRRRSAMHEDAAWVEDAGSFPLTYPHLPSREHLRNFINRTGPTLGDTRGDWVPVSPGRGASQPQPEPLRPPPDPMTDEEMTVKLDCKVCLEQRATHAFLPCGKPFTQIFNDWLLI